MIQSFSTNEKEIECTVIPRLSQCSEAMLHPGDTLIAFIDFQEYDMMDAQEFHKLLAKVFPNNQILILPKGTEIGVVRNEV